MNYIGKSQLDTSRMKPIAAFLISDPDAIAIDCIVEQLQTWFKQDFNVSPSWKQENLFSHKRGGTHSWPRG